MYSTFHAKITAQSSLHANKVRAAGQSQIKNQYKNRWEEERNKKEANKPNKTKQ